MGRAGCLSDSSSSDEERQALALAVAPQLARAAYDVLARPAGMSVRRLERHLVASFGQLPPGWSSVLCAANGLETYVPVKRLLPPLHHSEPGSVY